ncbi:MAG: BrnT family toxin [Terracidiphilus sp.]|jgi:hypothetical protein
MRALHCGPHLNSGDQGEAASTPVSRRLSVMPRLSFFFLYVYPVFITERIKWIWDDVKAKSNFLKHEIAFSEAALVFEDPLHASKPDPHPVGGRR